MLLRRTETGVIAISQPAHAWLAGMIARAWGNADFQRPAPFQDVCLAASLHDLGWLTWERTPEFDPNTGWPRVFSAVAAAVHTQFWRKAIAEVRAYGDYAAVLVSMHGNTIYERTFKAESARPEGADAVATFLDDQKILQAHMIANIRRDPTLAADASDAQIRFNKRFIAAVDTMSLHVCWGLDKIVTVKDVPISLTEDVTLTLEASGDGSILVDPWPFQTQAVVLRVHGRALSGPFDDAHALNTALADAPPHTVVTRMHPQAARAAYPRSIAL